jgi:hypothetical protein
MATYAAFDLGLIFEMVTVAAPNARQVNAYPGANGLEVIDLGSRGGQTTVLAALGASSSSGLATLIQGLRTLQVAGTANVLVDEFGVSWPGVILEMFAPVGPVRLGTGGSFLQRYQAQFLHVT